MLSSKDDALNRLSQTNVLDDVCLGRKTGVEENIKIKVVLPLLNLLGYETLKDMDFEHHVENKRADIALLVERKPKVIVETKSLDKTLEDHKVQALDYGRKKGISWIILTNGNEFQLYKSFIEGVEDKRNRPIFSARLAHLPQVFEQLREIVGKENLREIDKRTVTRVEAIRKAITEDELLETMKVAKRRLFRSFRLQFVQRFSNDAIFKKKIDKWVKEHSLDVKWTWEQSYKTDKNFRDLIDRILTQASSNDWRTKYDKDKKIRQTVDEILRENDVEVDWVDRLCSEGAYAFINRIMFLRICEDRGFVTIQTTKEFFEMMKKAAFGETVGSLLKELFGSISEKFIIYSKPLFDHITIEDLNWSKDDVLDTIEKTKKFNFKRIDRDIIGAVYEKHISRETRRRLGQFYTPEIIIQHILDQVPLLSNFKIIDPACGSGGFLVSAYDKLSKQMVKEGYDPTQIHAHLLKNVIYGVDIDPFATQLTVMNLLLKDLENPADVENVIDNNSLKTGLDSYSEKDVTYVQKKKKIATPANILREGFFDVVLGNPPYVNIKHKDPLYAHELQSYYEKVVCGIINSASLFAKRGIDLLRNNGVLGFVLPKSFLRVDSYAMIRKFILNKCEILSISDIGLGFEEVGYEVVTIILRKQEDKKIRQKNMVKIITNIADLTTNQFQSYSIPQTLFEKTNVFAIYLNEKLRPIVEKMKEDSKELGEIADIWRGLPISINSPLIRDYRQDSNDEQIIRGKDIGRYETKHHSFINLTSKETAKYVDAAGRLRCKKIVVQNIVTSKVRCVGTYDQEASLNIDTITNVKVTDKSFLEKYVLAVMNSKLGSFYIRDVIFNRAVLTMHMDKPYLGQLPIKIVSKATQEKIADKADKIMEIKKELSGTKFDIYNASQVNAKRKLLKALNGDLNERIYDIYGLDRHERQIIARLIPYT